MTELEREFFDTFKRLDALCHDMFSCQNGVSAYIRQMEETPLRLQGQIPSWNSDYRCLKHLRWLRNQIAHESSATDCCPADLEQLEAFHSRILNRQDPLAVLGTLLRESKPSPPRRSPAPQMPVRPAGSKPRRRNFFLAGLFLFAAVAAVLIALFALFLPWD